MLCSLKTTQPSMANIFTTYGCHITTIYVYNCWRGLYFVWTVSYSLMRNTLQQHGLSLKIFFRYFSRGYVNGQNKSSYTQRVKRTSYRNARMLSNNKCMSTNNYPAIRFMLRYLPHLYRLTQTVSQARS